MFITFRLSLRATLLACAPLLALAIAPASGQLQVAPESRIERAVETHVGRVEALEVDDVVRQRVLYFPQLRLGDGRVIALHGAMTGQLHRGDAVALTGVRNGVALEVRSIERQSASTIQPTSGSTTEVEGTLRIAHADYFDKGFGEFRYEVLHDDGTTTRLAVATLPSVLAGGMRVKVSAIAGVETVGVIPRRIAILSDAPDREATPRADVKAASIHRVLVVMANFSNTAAPAYTASQAQQIMTTNASSVAAYYNEASYGQHQLNVTVTSSWLTLAYAQPSSCIDGNLNAFTTAANNAASAAGYAVSNYEYVVYLFPSTPSCGWSGLAYVGSPKYAYIDGPGAFATQVIAHEMGHNFGLLHAGSLRCSGAVIGGICSAAEYGDPYSTMGNQHAGHFNAVQKSLLGWIGASTVQTHVSGTATYTLSPIETAGGALYAVKIPTPSSSRTYWLEYRQPIGFDAWSGWISNGVQIRVESPFETYCGGCSNWSDDTELLDSTPGTSSYTDAAFPVGSSFSDPNYPITVSVTSATPTALTVQVTTPVTATSTTTSLSASPNPAAAGTAVTFTARVTGSSPTGTVAFSDNGATISGCSAVALSGSGNTRTAQCSTRALTVGTHSIGASYSGDSTNGASTSTLTEQIVSSVGASINVALAANGGVASGSSTYSGSFPVSSINNNERAGANWGNGGGWNDATASTYPDWVQINFGGRKTIDRIVVYTLQDNYGAPLEPADTMTFTKWGLTGFEVQAWTGSAWYTVGTVSGNNLVKRTVSFTPIATDRIRIYVTSALGGYSRVTEVEAWTATTQNVASANNGGVASASSTYSGAFPVAALNNDERAGATWGNGGGWNDATANVLPDWVQINFNAARTIDRVVLYTLQDNYGAPLEPSDSMTFTKYGVTAFQVQTWSGGAWTTVGTVSGNNLVKRSVTFPPKTTDRVRVSITGALGGYSRVTELEAWGN